MASAATTLVVVASGVTGRLLVAQLLQRRQHVTVIVRSPDDFPEILENHDRLSVVHASVLDLSDAELAQHVNGCDTVALCLGDDSSGKGVYGHPRSLVTDATRRLCEAIRTNKLAKPTRLVLMTPHVDNENASEYLRTDIGQDNAVIEWVAVRPDNLVNEEEITAYVVNSSPIRSAIFDAGTTSRINVAHFMADLITGDFHWSMWKGQMPVIYNKASPSHPH